MKQNDWTNDLRRRLADREAPVPDDLWNKIEARLEAEKPHRRPRLLRLVAGFVAAAAAVALLVVVAYRANEDTITKLADTAHRNGGLPSATQPDVAAHRNGGLPSAAQPDVAAHRNGGLLSAAQPDVVAHRNGGLLSAAQPNVSANVDSQISDVVASKRSVDVEQCANDEPHVKNDERNTGSERFAGSGQHMAGESWLRGGQEPAVPVRSRFTVSAHTGGAFLDSYNADYPCLRNSKVSDMYADDGYGPVNGYALMGSAMLMPRYKEVKHHAQPVTVGLSVGYALNERLSLTTGVTYMRAVTDFIKSSGSDEISERQKLHYIGVPIGVKCNVWGNDRIQTYLTAGGEVYFNVAATLTAGGETSDTDRDRTLFSVNAAAGVQVNVVPHVGVYAEPGVKYYFDNKSQVETIFKDKPCNFSLQIGMRVGF